MIWNNLHSIIQYNLRISESTTNDFSRLNTVSNSMRNLLLDIENIPISLARIILEYKRFHMVDVEEKISDLRWFWYSDIRELLKKYLKRTSCEFLIEN